MQFQKKVQKRLFQKKTSSPRKRSRKVSPKKSTTQNSELIVATERDILSNFSSTEQEQISRETSAIISDINKNSDIKTTEKVDKLEKSVKDILGKLETAAFSGKKIQVAKYSIALGTMVQLYNSRGIFRFHKDDKYKFKYDIIEILLGMVVMIKNATIATVLWQLINFVEKLQNVSPKNEELN